LNWGRAGMSMNDCRIIAASPERNYVNHSR
jgi:hypothetical protein